MRINVMILHHLMHPKVITSRHLKAWALICVALPGLSLAQIAGRNINMVSGLQWPGGDPFLERQNEPSLAVSTRNPDHLLAGANDYRTVDLPGLATSETGDGWQGLFKSVDGGQTWYSTLIPGYPQDTSAQGLASPMKGYQAASDPVVRAGTNGLFYYSSLVFNRGTNAPSAVVVSRLIDNNNTESGDPFQFIGTSVVAQGTVGQGRNGIMLDKPWIAVDIPRSGALSCQVGNPLQSIPAGNVYIAYNAFAGGNELAGAVMFSRSLDCGVTWSTPLQIADSTSTNQGATLAIDPNTGAVYLAWRRFASAANTDSIMFAKSTDGGQTFTAPVVVNPITPFDQGNSSTTFRTNTYPTMTVDGNGLIYLAWSQRGLGPGGDARIVVSTSTNGVIWSAPVAADNLPGRGHQIMPSLTNANGTLALVYYDLREDTNTGNYTSLGGGEYNETRVPLGDLATQPPHPEKVFTTFIDDGPGAEGPLLRRHNLDVRVAQARQGIGLQFTSVQVSQYPVGSRPNATLIEQLQMNVPNLPMFALGTLPFIGDYIDIAALTFVQNASGVWTFNTSPSTAPVFNAVWTDNRDVSPPIDGNWAHYTPPISASTRPLSIFDPTQPQPACQVGFDSSRNQNIYFSRITQGLIAGSPGNSRPLNAQFPRAFVITLRNTTSAPLSFRMAIANQPAGGRASFVQRSTSSASIKLDITIPPSSSIARTVFVQSPVAQAQVRVDIAQITAPNGTVITGGLQSSVQLNPDATNPPNPALSGVEIYNPDVSNPDVSNPDVSNPDVSNPDVSNPDPLNVVVANPDVSNPDVSNPDVSNPDVSNPDVSNPDVSNPDVSNGLIQDVTWRVTNTGNTHSSYTVYTVLANSFPAGFIKQMIINKIYTTPVANNCALQYQTTTETLANITNPVFLPASAVSNPSVSNSAANNPTLSIGPNEVIRITMRVVNPNRLTNTNFNPAKAMITAVTSHSVNTTDFLAGSNQPPVTASQLLIITNALPSGQVGVQYPATTLTSAGGTAPVTWSVPPGTLPAGLTLSAGGVITGTPTVAGTFSFTVTASDSSAPQEVFMQTLSIVVAPQKPLVITSTSVPNGYVGANYSFQLTASGGLGNRTWSVSAGTLPAGLVLTAAGVISGTPQYLQNSTFTVMVTDSSPIPLSTTHQFTLQIVPYTLLFTVQPAGTHAGQTIPVSVKVQDSFGNGVAGVPVTIAISSGGARFFDAVNDFSIASNPNGAWSYGDSQLSGFALLTSPLPASTCTTPPGGECWTNGQSFPSTTSIIHNTTPNTLVYNGTILQPPNVLNLAVQSGFPTVRFVSPATDNYNIAGQFTRIDTQPNPVNVSIGHNLTTSGGTTVFSAFAFNDPFNPQTFSFNISLAAGDTLDFIANSTGNPTDDSTGLSATITSTTGANLGGTTTVASGTNGIAQFTNLSINAPGTFTLKATQPDSTTAVSSGFTIVP